MQTSLNMSTKQKQIIVEIAARFKLSFGLIQKYNISTSRGLRFDTQSQTFFTSVVLNYSIFHRVVLSVITASRNFSLHMNRLYICKKDTNIKKHKYFLHKLINYTFTTSILCINFKLPKMHSTNKFTQFSHKRNTEKFL